MYHIWTGILLLLFVSFGYGQGNERSPEDCQVLGEAALYGVKIRGTLELTLSSLCFGFQPFATLRYAHPEYRDLHIWEVPLVRGQRTPFEFVLESWDLTRAIHPVQVVVYVRASELAEAVPVTSFWLEARAWETAIPDKETGLMGSFLPMPNRRGEGERAACEEIRALALKNHPGRPTAPAILTWEQPECCREQACHYAIWGGRAMGELRLLIHGQASGLRIHKILPNLHPEDSFFELVIETPGGIRHAIYQTPVSEPLPVPAPVPPAVITQPEEPSEMLADSPRPVPEETAKTVTLENPQLPVSDFYPCRYERALILQNGQAVIAGDKVEIRYDHDRNDYQYTLYFMPEGAAMWYLAPGTKELQELPVFTWQAAPGHSGRYLVLVYKPSKKWGCLSSAPAEALRLRVQE